MKRRSTPSLSLLPAPLAALAALTAVVLGPGSAWAQDIAPRSSGAPKVLHLPMRTDGPKTLDPVKGSTTYDNRASSLVYETLLQYSYLKRKSLQLEPLLVSRMPEPNEDRTVWRFELKEGVRFHDDACFAGGKGRILTSGDVFYSWKRIADESNAPKCWWLVRDTIVGFDEYRAEQNAAADFDYDAPVPGLVILDERRFEVRLKQPVPRFLYVLAMFQTSIVPREAVERYGEKFGAHPVGTGPFVLREEDWVKKKSMVFRRNPNYRLERYPSDCDPELAVQGFAKPAGTPLPIVDEIRISMFTQDNPMWLQFKAGQILYTQVPAENFGEAFSRRRRTLRSSWKNKGFRHVALPLLDFIFRGFNMADPLVGHVPGDPEQAEKNRKLRRAISYAIDLQEFNDVFYNGQNIIYDGPVPPGLRGHPEGGRAEAAARGPAIDRAKQLMAEAGYPEGKGLPPLEYWVSRSGNSQEQTELLKRQFREIGVTLKVRLVDFSQLMSALDRKRGHMFGYAWSSDYPDGENNFSLFFGPNEAPGNNSFNYKNAEYDALYRQILRMEPSPERDAIYVRMREILLHDAPYIGSMARTRYYLINPALLNFVPSEDFANWPKYLDLDMSKHARR